MTGDTMTHVKTAKFRIATLIGLGASMLAAAAIPLASSPFVAGWVWIR